jgi:hypothetical protein
MYLVFLPVGRRVRYISATALRAVEDDEKGTRCLKVQLGDPVTGRHKYRDLVLQIRKWTQGWLPCSVKRTTVAKSGWSN